MLATVYSAALQGIDAVSVHVEVNSNESGEPKLIMVGLPDAAVKESDDRVFSALSNSGFRLPRTRTTINLAPGSLRKEGPMYDLPIALGILAATGQMERESLEKYLIAGELSLSGATRPIKGALAMAILAREMGKEGILLPPGSSLEAALVEGIAVYPVSSLDSAFRFLIKAQTIFPVESSFKVARERSAEGDRVDFSEIKGQHGVRRAVEIAVAGGHNLLMIGPPGSGKSMIAKRIPTIMPDPTLEQYLEILRINSAVGRTLSGDIPFLERPHRAPHHTISDIGLLGGGSIPGPGEVSLAHHGILFLDELPEFKRSVLEVLRQPLEEGSVSISRSAGKVTLPCQFMLVAAMNPCPCGYLGDSKHDCHCSAAQIHRYRSRISGPLLDRIDLHVEAPALSFEELRNGKKGETSEEIRARVSRARDIQEKRDPFGQGACNARIRHAQIAEFCAIDRSLGDLLQQAMEQLSLSARAYDRVLRVSRTIADLAGSENIQAAHLLEAIQYRSLDRNLLY
ncbi:MAG: YifB family Mg chelatase-like AAA ATPase [Opitutales bacterium]